MLKGKGAQRDWRTDALLRAIEAGALDADVDEYVRQIESSISTMSRRLTPAEGRAIRDRATKAWIERVREFAREIVGRELLKDGPERVANWAVQRHWAVRSPSIPPRPFESSLRWSHR